ncbi:[Fe-Fe] hydrogenase large subunit C-terminal domain-containing protein [Anaerotalea alkaliphila]|uniref:4Fe-4S dicluster domain-containing protein n=1 Tax=Anaerotalea alkaliphila TaxID=2662126 RepID=A0A7X5HWU9_9FIRM|nr:[Fe-Fe] hydrogenase large subunit C-terminal domain-containing protein [Anaerotalea alkaliphila]NDL67961.1 4Fe-4S dicluster domain-containing protein [Anaerotalea alkaliphila]
MSYTHSVTLDWEKCIGCTDCIKRCPTEAIRVRNSKAEIMNDRCIDCGNCIRVCSSHAKKATTDPIEMMADYKYKVAIPAPTLYTQFKKLRNPNIILTALKKMGFDEVFEVALGADVVTEYSKLLVQEKKVQLPMISSACPAIVHLVQMRFPTLIPNIMPVISPKEAIARYARNHLVKKGIPSDDIGIFFISPCGAKVTDTRDPEVFDTSMVNGVFSMKEIYLYLVPIIRELGEDEVEVLQMGSANGIGWAAIGGESTASEVYNRVAVDGIENVINILERMENNKLDVEFVEALACVNGCLGGPLTVENSFVATNRMLKIRKYLQFKGKTRDLNILDSSVSLDWDRQLSNKQVMKLDEDMFKALEKMERMEALYETLPQIDCGSCGSPTCRSFAEDVVMEHARIEDCIFMLREQVRKMAEDMVKLAEKLPPSIRTKGKGGEDE